MKHGLGVSCLKIGAPAGVDEKGISREQAIFVHQKRNRVTGVTRGKDHLNFNVAHQKDLSIFKQYVLTFYTGVRYRNLSRRKVFL